MKILIAYDGSQSGAAALEDLKRAGLGAEAEVLVMSVAEVFVPTTFNEEVVPAAVKRAREHAQHQLDHAGVLAGRASEHIKSMFPNWRVSHHAEADSPAVSARAHCSVEVVRPQK